MSTKGHLHKHTDIENAHKLLIHSLLCLSGSLVMKSRHHWKYKLEQVRNSATEMEFGKWKCGHVSTKCTACLLLSRFSLKLCVPGCSRVAQTMQALLKTHFSWRVRKFLRYVMYLANKSYSNHVPGRACTLCCKECIVRIQLSSLINHLKWPANRSKENCVFAWVEHYFPHSACVYLWVCVCVRWELVRSSC